MEDVKTLSQYPSVDRFQRPETKIVLIRFALALNGLSQHHTQKGRQEFLQVWAQGDEDGPRSRYDENESQRLRVKTIL